MRCEHLMSDDPDRFQNKINEFLESMEGDSPDEFRVLTTHYTAFVNNMNAGEVEYTCLIFYDFFDQHGNPIT